MRKALFFLMFAAIVFGCDRQYTITKRARLQLPVSLNERLTDIVPAAGEAQIRNLKIVYENDSICLLQFTAAYKDTADVERTIDLRYIYLYDDFGSIMNGKMTFNEVFRVIPCMPDDLIKKNRENVRKNNESVYKDLYGSTMPVMTPFDE